MAGLEPLFPLIYHEKQQQGSMLCAQHALNNLLQGNYFSAPDLSEIARNLDDLERSYDIRNPAETSHNMDDTGFFSVQVLENALEVWGLSLLRWRGEEMRPYQGRPEEERAFIFNQQQHWFTVRRFGFFEGGTGSIHWFDLNSSNPKPEWLSKLYVQMFIQQAEADGYSVFVVRQTDPEAPPSLPRTEADDVASTLTESSGPQTNRSGPVFEEFEGLENEDMELQMALQASLGPPTDPPRLLRPSLPLPTVESDPPSGSGSGTRTPSQQPVNSSPLESPTQDRDSIAASMAQSRRVYERMLAEQTQAHRELEAEGGRSTRRRQEEEVEEEEEMLRRAIAESEAMARIEGHGRPDSDHERDDMDVDRTRNAQGFTESRVYDDEDQEFQAALRASLGQVPEGWSALPETPPLPNLNLPHTAAQPSERMIDDEESIASEDSPALESSDAPEAPAQTVDVEEMRRRRLARFGG